MKRKERVIISDQQKLEYENMMVEDAYNTHWVTDVTYSKPR